MSEWGKSKMGGNFLKKEIWCIKGLFPKNSSNPVSCCGKCCWIPRLYSFAPLSGKDTLPLLQVDIRSAWGCGSRNYNVFTKTVLFATLEGYTYFCPINYGLESVLLVFRRFEPYYAFKLFLIITYIENTYWSSTFLNVHLVPLFLFLRIF